MFEPLFSSRLPTVANILVACYFLSQKTKYIIDGENTVKPALVSFALGSE